MKNRVRPIPDGYHTATPYLILRDGARAIEFYKRTFGAKELMRMPGPDGRIMHAEIQIGDSRIMLADESPENGSPSPQTLKGTAVGIFLYVEDVDAVFKRAVAAGARELMPVADMFWGDRFGKISDPFGHQWQLATHKEDLQPDEIGKRAEAAFSK